MNAELTAKKGVDSNTLKLKWFFYIYYPAHLIAIGIIRLAMYGDISLIFR